MAAYQSAITIAGQNIANVGNSDYTRQSGHLAAQDGGMTPAGVIPGTGVNMDTLQRHLDQAVEGRLRLALAQRNGADTRYQTLNGVESMYNELTDSDLSTQLGNLFGSFANLQTDPTEITARDQVVSCADSVIATLQRYRSGLLDSAAGLNDTAASLVKSANSMASEIAKLNEQIVAASARASGGDSALRDRRDALVRGLAEMMDIQTREQDNGVTNVYVGSEPLVEFDRSRGLTTETTLEQGVERMQIRFADNKGTVTVREGQLAAIAEARDVDLAGQLDKLDQLAKGLIYEVNRVHSGGRGLVGQTSLTSTNAVSDPDAPLSSAAAGLPFPVQNGTFLVQVRDRGSDRTTTRMIEVDLDGLVDEKTKGDADTSLTSLAKALNAVPGLKASVTADNRLAINSDGAYDVSFSDDSSGLLAALGIGGLFEGTDVATIAVNSAVRSDPHLIAASLDGAPGDGGNAGRLAAAGSTASELLGDLGVQDFHASIVNQLAVDTAAAKTTYESNDTVYSSLLAQRESVSGVNLDEEAINLTMFERAFQGASRYLSVLDTLSDSVLNLVQ